MIDDNNRGPLFKSGTKAVNLGRKGGLSRSPAKSLGQKLKWLKQKGDDELDLKELAEIMTNPDLSALQILQSIRTLKQTAVTDKKPALLQWCIGAELQWHQVHHGRKVQVESKNINVDVKVMTVAKWAEVYEEVEAERAMIKKE